MDYLDTRYAIAAFPLAPDPKGGAPLVDQVQPFLALTPYLLLDLGGIALTSMHLGELVNVANAARTRWPDRFRGLLLVRVSEQARRAIAMARLEGLLRAFPSADAALAACEAEAEAEMVPEWSAGRRA